MALLHVSGRWPTTSSVKTTSIWLGIPSVARSAGEHSREQTPILCVRRDVATTGERKGMPHRASWTSRPTAVSLHMDAEGISSALSFWRLARVDSLAGPLRRHFTKTYAIGYQWSPKCPDSAWQPTHHRGDACSSSNGQGEWQIILDQPVERVSNCLGACYGRPRLWMGKDPLLWWCTESCGGAAWQRSRATVRSELHGSFWTRSRYQRRCLICNWCMRANGASY